MRKHRNMLPIPDDKFYKAIQSGADAEGIPMWKHLMKVYSANQKDLMTIFAEKYNGVRELYGNLVHVDNKSSVDELTSYMWAILANTIRGKYDSKKVLELIKDHIDNGEFIVDGYEGD